MSRRRKQKDPEKRKRETEELILEVTERVVESLGIGEAVPTPYVRELVESLVAEMSEGGKKVEAERVVKKIESQRDNVYKALIARALSEGEPTPELAELAVYRAPELAGKAAPLLYRLLKGSPHALEYLKGLWERYGSPTPVRCPVCGFMSIAPDLQCVICGASPKEEEVKASIDLESELRRAARSWHESLIREALSAGYIYYDGEVKPPSMGGGRLGVLLHLSKREKAVLQEELARRALHRGL